MWFDIDLWKVSLDSAVEKLKSLAPDEADYFEENKQKYFAQLDELKAEAQDKLSQIPEKRGHGNRS